MSDAPFDAFRFAHEHWDEIAWLSQNTNHLGPSRIVQEALAEAVRARHYEGYPFAPGAPELRDLVLKDLGFPADAGLQISAGGTEALYMLIRALLGSGDEVVASDPSYLIIHKFVELAGARTVNLPLYAPPYRMTPDRVNEAITPHTKMILLIDPLNPLGSGYPKEDIRAIAEIAKDHKLVLLNDTTYRDFSESHTLAHPFYPEGTVTVWSVSKNCGLAGIRMGGLLARKELYDKIWRFNTNDLGVNVFAQAAAVAALEEKPKAFPAVVRQSRENQRRIHEAVQGWKGVSLPVYPSQGNMFVLDVAEHGVDPEALQKELLLKHGVFLRAGNYLSPGFGKRFIRASFSNVPKDIDRFLKAFPLALEATSGSSSRLVAPAAGR